MNLEPKGASLQAKFELNQLIGHPSRDGGKNFVGLRISRMNHDCRPNAGYSYDETARAEIVFAQRDIQPGEEICISYFTYATQHLSTTTSPEKIWLNSIIWIKRLWSRNMVSSAQRTALVMIPLEKN